MKAEDVKNSSSLQFEIRHWVRQVENGKPFKDVIEEVYAVAFNSGRSYGAYYDKE